MLTDYHVHIERGPYTFEWLDKFMDTAHKNGITEIGIVEHSHRFTEMSFLYNQTIQDETPIGQCQKRWLDSRLGQITIPEYVEFITEAKKRGYPVRLGLEICYFPHYAKEIGQILSSIPADFIIGSIHWLNGWGFDHPERKAEWREKEQSMVWQEFQQHTIAAITSGLFDIIGHIDCIKAFSPWTEENWLGDSLIPALVKHNLCVEVNTGVKYRVDFPEICPSANFLSQCRAHGIDITLASDAHFPDDVGRLFTESVTLAKRSGYTESVRFTNRQRSKVEL